MVGKALKHRIEVYCDSLLKANPFFKKASQGELSAEHVARLLISAEKLIAKTPVHLKMARDRASELDQVALAEFFDAKLNEEVGHDEWAKEDLSALQSAFALTPRDHLLSAVEKLTRHLESMIQENPALYLSYILLAEYYIVILGPELLDRLERQCGIPPSMLSVIAKHVALDREHVVHDLAELSELATKQADLEPLLTALERTLPLHERIYSEAGEWSV